MIEALKAPDFDLPHVGDVGKKNLDQILYIFFAECLQRIIKSVTMNQ